MTCRSGLIVLVSEMTSGLSPPVASAGSRQALRPPDGRIALLTPGHVPSHSGVGRKLCFGASRAGVGVETGAGAERPGAGAALGGGLERARASVGSPARGGLINHAARR